MQNKKYHFILLTFILFISNIVQGQNEKINYFCDVTSNSNSRSILLKCSLVDEGYGVSCTDHNSSVIPSVNLQVPIIAWVFRNDDIDGDGICDGGINYSHVENAIDNLSDYFSSSNISFDIDLCFEIRERCDSEFIDFSMHTGTTAPETSSNYKSAVILKYYEQNKINIYFPEDVLNYPPPSTNFIAGSVCVDGIGGILPSEQGLWVGGSTTDPAHNRYSPTTLAHELGHLLGLYHTFHNNGGNMPESCDNPDPCNLGDYVQDTPIDEGLGSVSNCSNVTSENCLTDDETIELAENIMSSGAHTLCRMEFSPFQRRKMYDILCGCKENSLSIGTDEGFEVSLNIFNSNTNSTSSIDILDGSVINLNPCEGMSSIEIYKPICATSVWSVSRNGEILLDPTIRNGLSLADINVLFTSPGTYALSVESGCDNMVFNIIMPNETCNNECNIDINVSNISCQNEFEYITYFSFDDLQGNDTYSFNLCGSNNSTSIDEASPYFIDEWPSGNPLCFEISNNLTGCTEQYNYSGLDCSSGINLTGPWGCYSCADGILVKWTPNTTISPNKVNIELCITPDCTNSPGDPQECFLMAVNVDDDGEQVINACYELVLNQSGNYDLNQFHFGDASNYYLKIYDVNNTSNNDCFSSLPIELTENGCETTDFNDLIIVSPSFCLEDEEVIEFPLFPVDVALELCPCNGGSCLLIANPITANSLYSWAVGELANGGTAPPGCYNLHVYELGNLDNNGFSSQFTLLSNCSTPEPTCTDGIQNNGETQTDCGGPNCPPCSSCPLPTNVQYEIINNETEVIITWDNAEQDAHEVCFSETGLLECEVVPSVSNSITFDIYDCNIFYYEVRRICSDAVNESEESNPITGSFTIDSGGCCDGESIVPDYNTICAPEGGYVIRLYLPSNENFIIQGPMGQLEGVSGTTLYPGPVENGQLFDVNDPPPSLTIWGGGCADGWTIDPIFYQNCLPSCASAPFVIPTSLTINCNQDPLDLSITGEPSTDCTTCDIPTSTITQNNNGCNGTGTVTREWTYTNECDNVINQTQTITIIDSQPPSLLGPDDVTVSCGENVDDLTITGDYQSQSDNCSTNLTPTYTDDSDLSGCGGTGTITRTWSVTDDCNNTTTDVQIITVEAAAGTFTCPADVTVLCNESIDPADTGNPVADVCGGSNAATFTDSGTLTAGGTITRSWAITDACGTPYNCDQLISMGACIASIDDPCSCSDGMNYLLNGSYFFHEVVEITSASGQQWDMTNISSGEAYDDAGNILTLPFTGTETPAGSGLYLFNFWHTSGVGFSADFTEATTLEVISIGNVCTIPTLDVVCPSTNDLGTYNCNTLGNIPACPTDEASAEAVPYGLTIDDMPCGDIVILCADDVAINNCVVGGQTITRTITVLDDLNSNGLEDAGEPTVDCTFTITIEPDEMAPMISCPAGIDVEGCSIADFPSTGGTPVFSTTSTPILEADFVALGATVSDNCSIASITYIDVAVGTCPITITRTYMVTDDCSNTTACDQIFTIDDTTAPIATCPAMLTIEGCSTADITGVNPPFSLVAAPITEAAYVAAGGSVEEACNIASITYLDSEAGTCPIVVTRVFTLTDDCGNEDVCSQIIEIDDTTEPVVSCPANVDIEGCNTDAIATTGAPAFATVLSNITEAEYLDLGGIVIEDCPIASVTYIDVAVGTCPIIVTRTYTLTDDCNNSTTCEQVISIDDTTPPLVVPALDMIVECDGAGNAAELVAWLADNGGATATDECGFVWTNNFTALSDDCGETGSATVTFTATDPCDNASETTATFSIVDTQAPVVVNPPNSIEELICFDGIPVPFNSQETFLSGGGSIEDDCSDVFTVFAQTTTTGDFCPNGNPYTLSRTYFVIDECGLAGTDPNGPQIIQYQESQFAPVITSVLPSCYKYCGSLANPMEADITYTTDCSLGATVTINGPEIIGTADCSGTIYRFTYIVTDECGRDSDPAIRDFIIGNDSPTIECAPFNLILECGDLNNQEYIDTHLDQVIVNTSCQLDYTVNTSPDNFNLLACGSSTVVTFVATDACGRTASCTTTITIIDNTAPTILSVPPSVCDITNCSADVNYWYNHWIDYMINGIVAEDDCNNDVSIQAVNTPLNTDCPNGTAATVVTFTATDNCGNVSEITGTFIVQETPSSLTLMGIIATEEQETVESVEVTLEGNNTLGQMMETGIDGIYGFTDLLVGNNYTVTPYSNDNPLNGVSSYDLVLISKHILQAQQLDSPYKMIAADVNHSGSITTMDLVELRKLILHITEEFSNNTSWRFVDADFVFPQANNPFATLFPETVHINGLTETEQHDFVGVKVGDVNGSAVPNAFAGGEDRSFDGELHFDLNDIVMKAGVAYEVAFRSSDFSSINGFQYTLNFDQDQLSFVKINAGRLPAISDANFGLRLLERGSITTSWIHHVPLSMDANEELFYITFIAKEDVQLSEALRITSGFTEAEAYRSHGSYETVDLLDVSLRFNNIDAFTLLQNIPNPFKEMTTIGFILPEPSTAKLTIYDVSGRVLKVIEGEYQKGSNYIDLQSSDLVNGAMYYELLTPLYKGVRKMILIK